MKFHASKMPRVVYCPGSAQIESRYKDVSVWEAQEGTAAHDVGARCLNTGTDAVALQGQTVQGFIVDVEMVRAVSLYVGTCREILETGFSTSAGVETRHQASEGPNTLGCAVDFWSFDAVAGVLYVLDFKYGHGWVEAFENWQLLAYAVALMEKAMESGYVPKEVRLGIVQPRANHPDGPVRWWKFNGELLRNYRNNMFQAMRQATIENPPTISGPHCRYCRGLLHCHTMDAALAICMDVAGRSGDSIKDPDAEAWELMLIEKAIKTLGYKKAALETAIFERLKTGGKAQGYETTNTWSALAWDVDAIAVGRLTGKDLRQEEKPITPTQAIDRGILTEAEAKKMAGRKQTGLKLRPINLERVRRILNG
jgi:hypothetical protein